MATAQQTAANRRNAKQSTGPRTVQGKARSRHNALTHGLTAEQVVLPDEAAEEFEALREAIFMSLAPEDSFQDQLVERAASLIWRLRRVPVFEVALFEWMKRVQVMEYDGVGDRWKRRALAPDAYERADIGEQEETATEVFEIGRTLDGLLVRDLTNKLTRYETALQRQLEATLNQLRQLKASQAPLPKVIDTKKNS